MQTINREVQDLSEPELKRMREAASHFGYGGTNQGEQIRIGMATEGFR